MQYKRSFEACGSRPCAQLYNSFKIIQLDGCTSGSSKGTANALSDVGMAQSLKGALAKNETEIDDCIRGRHRFCG